MKYFPMLLLLLPLWVMAEQLNVEYTEPSGDTAVFTDTSLWTCRQIKSDDCNCTDFQRRVVTPNQSGSTAATIQPDYDVPIREDELPVCVRYTVTVRLGQNETAPGAVVGSQVFTAAP